MIPMANDLARTYADEVRKIMKAESDKIQVDKFPLTLVCQPWACGSFFRLAVIRFNGFQGCEHLAVVRVAKFIPLPLVITLKY